MATATVRPARRPSNAELSIRAELQASPLFRSAQSVFTAMREQGGNVGLSTVYRRLQAMSESGEVDTIHTDGGEILYRLCGPEMRHHHHLVCRRCGTTVEIEGRGVERWADRVAEENGFVDVDHTLELQGVCQRCASGRAAPKGRRAR